MFRPWVFLQTRQELCETEDSYRSHQAGVYFRKELISADENVTMETVAKGYLLAGWGDRRDACLNHALVIISHG